MDQWTDIIYELCYRNTDNALFVTYMSLIIVILMPHECDFHSHRFI